MNYFFIEDTNESSVHLNLEESRHCIQVLRHKTGDEIYLVDGVGNRYKSVIQVADKKKCHVAILSKKSMPGNRDFHLHIAIAPTKNRQRIEWFLEKVTEIGIDEVSFINCKHSERRHLRIDRLSKIALSAMKQSGSFIAPRLNAMVNFNLLIQQQGRVACRFIAHCMETEKKTMKQAYHKGKDVLIIIGPEGDFSEKERNLARSAGFQEVSLGNQRLRTETAGVVACQIVNFMNED